MTAQPSSASDTFKQAAALHALEAVEDGMKLGIGTGSTADHFTRALGQEVARGRKVISVATSERTAALARECGIPLVDLDAAGTLDLTIDGADEIDPQLRLIKGGGGALLREKIVAVASRRVLEKAGLRLVRRFHQPWPYSIPGEEEGDVEYALLRSEWEGDASS